MATRAEYSARKNRESLGKRLGHVAGQIKARDGHRCVYCGADEIAEARAGKQLQLDHLKTHISGGKDTPNNLATACKRCNAARHDMTLEQFSKWANEHLNIKIDPAKIRAQAAQPLPDRKEVQRDAVEQYAAVMREHRAEATRAKDPRVKDAHKAAAVVAGMARQAAKEGRLSGAIVRAVRQTSAAAHKAGIGEHHDEKGRFSPGAG